MKIGTDGVLVGAWAHGGSRMLDLGAGSGLIALMLAQRFPHSTVDGVELDPQAASQARDNVRASPFAHRISIHTNAFQHFQPAVPYDAIVSNPPFFLNALQTPDETRAAARHAQADFFKDLFRFVRHWLLPTGEVSLIVPRGSVSPIADEAYLAGLFLSRLIAVRTKPTKPVERCLIAFSKQRQGYPELGEVCLLQDDGSKSAWYDEITHDFYR